MYNICRDWPAVLRARCPIDCEGLTRPRAAETWASDHQYNVYGIVAPIHPRDTRAPLAKHDGTIVKSFKPRASHVVLPSTPRRP